MIEPVFHEFLNSPIGDSKHFTWSEALWLPRWQIHVMPEHPDVIKEVKYLAKKLDLIRGLFGRPIEVTNWYRPLKYNDEVGGAKRSSHLFGMAADFNVIGLMADQVRSILSMKLAELNIRMERLPGANWVHIDTNCQDGMKQEQRYFIP